MGIPIETILDSYAVVRNNRVPSFPIVTSCTTVVQHHNWDTDPPMIFTVPPFYMHSFVYVLGVCVCVCVYVYCYTIGIFLLHVFSGEVFLAFTRFSPASDAKRGLVPSSVDSRRPHPKPLQLSVPTTTFN